MALITCPDCGQAISDKATACIHCGCPIAAQPPSPISEPATISRQFDGIVNKEYKGYGGNQVVVEGDAVHIKQLLMKEDCTFADITDIQWREPSGMRNGCLTITTKTGHMPYQIIFLKGQLADFSELRGLLEERMPLPAAGQVQGLDPAVARCPKCGSTSLSASNQGFSAGKAAAGVLLTGGIGLLAGGLGSKNVTVTCLNCGHKFKPGK